MTAIPPNLPHFLSSYDKKCGRFAGRGGQALVIGKFLPPHAGHLYVIDTALRHARTVDVVVCDDRRQRPTAKERARWLATIYGASSAPVGVLTIGDVCHHGARPCWPACSTRWARHLRGAGLGPYDAVFGSEAYIPVFARELGARAVVVDRARQHRPVSGTAVRADLAGHWHQLHPVVRAGLTRRIVVVGAESTGTTTLARDLAGRLGCPWVPEVGRDVSATKAARAGSIEAVRWESADFDVIADAQEALEAATIADYAAEAQASRRLNHHGPFVVCDTDVLATAIWHRRYCGTEAPPLFARAAARPPALYVLTRPEDVVFEQDGLRDGEHLRGLMTTWFETALAGQPQPWIAVRGSRDQRVRQVVEALAGLAPLFATAGEPVRIERVERA